VSSGGVADGERAAFIVDSTNGSYAVVLWPRTNERLAATWHGPIPPRTIAIAHTHPVNMPRPSRNDIAQAIQLRVPLIVVSRTHIFLIDATGGVTLFAGTGWQKHYSSPAGD
jgi:proteasome lid subunit RPN8/RPN11